MLHQTCLKFGCHISFADNQVTHNRNCPFAPNGPAVARIVKTCELCAGQAVGDHSINHRPDCPNHPDAIDDTPQPEPAASNVASLTRKRFEKFDRPKDNHPLSALDMAREWIDAQPTKPEHVIVLIGRTTEDGSSGTKYFQAGGYPHHAQMGLCIEGMHMMRDSG